MLFNICIFYNIIKQYKDILHYNVYIYSKMYYEDLLETAANVSENASVVWLSDYKNSGTTAAVSKKCDPNYEKFSVPLNKWKNGKFYKTNTIQLYGSGQIGYRIRNAVTGQKYPYLVGSAEEDLFFKVCDSNGRYGRKHPLILFYDSPEQYENQQDVIISQVVKDRWQEKNLIARQRLISN